MEGAGSRLGRASLRFGPATVFSGPVRKWKKRWVRVSSSTSSSSSSPVSSFQNTHSSRSSNGIGNHNPPTILLCRWIPISPALTADSDNSSVMPEEPPRRKLHYTPIIVLEEQKKEVAEKVDEKVKTSKSSSITPGMTSRKSGEAYNYRNTDGAFIEEFQVVNKKELAKHRSNTRHINLDVGLKGRESDGESMEAKLGEVSSGGVWA